MDQQQQPQQPDYPEWMDYLDKGIDIVGNAQDTFFGIPSTRVDDGKLFI